MENRDSSNEDYIVLTYISSSDDDEEFEGEEEEGEDKYWKRGGDTVLEVFRVKINRQGNLSGTIFFTKVGSQFTQVVYNNQYNTRGEEGGGRSAADRSRCYHRPL